jgi:YVTN family beta-propeller protein
MRLRSALAAAVASAAALGCGLNQEGIAPPTDRIFYPGAIAVDPTGSWLYVVNSNADLRFNDGTMMAINMALVREKAVGRPTDLEMCHDGQFINPITGPENTCCWDALDSNILDCDERQFVAKDSTVKIGSFGSALAIQVDKDTGRQRLLAAVRGNASITWIDTTTVVPDLADRTHDQVSFACAPNATPGAFGECDEAHRVTMTTDPNRPVEEPYALALDQTQKLLYVGHLRAGYLSVVNLAGNLDTDPPTFVGVFPGIFPGDVNGSVGVTSLTLTQTGINSGRIYATSRFVPRAGAFAPISLGDLSGTQAQNNHDIFLANAGDVFVSPLVGSEVRGIQIIPEINRTFMLQRTPPALVGFNTSNGQNIPTDVVEMCNGPTFLHMTPPFQPDDDQGLDKRLFVTCFESGEVYVVDPYSPRVIAIVEVGRGPAGLAFSNDDPLHPLAFVAGFGANNLSVIDLAPGSATQYHVVLRIGFPTPVPR